MIRFACSGCEKKLSVRDELAGRTAVCPSCKTKVRIPHPETAGEDDRDQAAIAPPPQPAPKEDEAPVQDSRRGVEEKAEELEEVDELEEVEDDDETARAPRTTDREDDEEPYRKPIRQRKKTRAKGKGWDWFSGETMFNKIVLAALSLCFMLAVLAVFLPFLALIPLILSIVMLFTAHIIVLLAAFQDDSMSGCLCLFVPFYAIYFILTHLDEVRSALLLYAGSLILVIVSFCGLFAAGAFWRAVTPPPRHFQITWPAVERIAAG